MKKQKETLWAMTKVPFPPDIFIPHSVKAPPKGMFKVGRKNYYNLS